MSDAPEDMENRMKECPRCGQKAPKGQVNGYGKCARCYFSEMDNGNEDTYRDHEDIEASGSGSLDSGRNLVSEWKRSGSGSSDKDRGVEV